MGQQSSKAKSHKGLSSAEKEILADFKSLFKERPVISKDDAKSLWSASVVDEHIRELLRNYYFKDGSQLSSEKYSEPFSHLIEGGENERITAVSKLLSSENKEIKHSSVHSYVEHVFTSYVEIHKTKETKNYESWKNAVNVTADDQLRALVKHLCRDLLDCSEVSVSDLTAWVRSWTLYALVQEVVFYNLYCPRDTEPLERNNLIPFWNRTANEQKFPSILSWPSIIFLNYSLPSKLRSEWRLLFSTAIHGESFSKLIGLAMNQGPTVIIVKDGDGHVFGGFAPSTWTLNPNFVGDNNSFLFTILPVMDRFEPTGYNDHYQYLNVQQQTMPNGLGMGGQHGYFGLWLDAEFGTGHCSETCTTFQNYRMLSAKKKFKIDHVEVWGVGPKPEVEEESRGRSVLDTETEARAVMEMAGKVHYSEGLREPEEED